MPKSIINYDLTGKNRICLSNDQDIHLFKTWQITILTQKMISQNQAFNDSNKNCFDQYYSIIVLVPTGIAISNINRYTIHSACGFGIYGTCNNNNLTVIKSSNTSAPFARLNIHFSDDFMQLSLVLDPALYIPSNVSKIINLSEKFQAANDIELDSNSKRHKHALYKPLINNHSLMNTIGRNLWLN
ncbi:5748_t:CDS:2, partial [Cetraspora pellucida]